MTPFEKRLSKFIANGFTEAPLDPKNPPKAIHAGGEGRVPHVISIGDVHLGITHKAVARMLVAGDESLRLLCAVLDSMEHVVRAEGNEQVSAALIDLLSAIPTLQKHVARTMRELEIPTKPETTH